MYLRDVMVLPASSGRVAIGRIRQASDHVLDILRQHLPKKYDLGGMRRVVIELGSTESSDRKKFRHGGLGIGHYSDPDFDVEQFFELPPQEQEKKIVQCVECCLVDLAQQSPSRSQYNRSSY